MDKKPTRAANVLNKALTARFGGAKPPTTPQRQTDAKVAVNAQLKAVRAFLNAVRESISQQSALPISYTVNVVDCPDTVTWEIEVGSLLDRNVTALYTKATAAAPTNLVPPQAVQNRFKQVAGTMGWHAVEWKFYHYNPVMKSTTPYRYPRLFLVLTWKRPYERPRTAAEIEAARQLDAEMCRG